MYIEHGGIGLLHLYKVGREGGVRTELCCSSTGLLLDSDLLVLRGDSALEFLQELVLVTMVGEMGLYGEGELV